MKNILPAVPKVTAYLMYILVISYILPSGIIGKISVQRICIYLLLVLSVWIALQNNTLPELVKYFKLEIFVTSAGILWLGIGLLKKEDYSAQFFLLLYVTLFLFIAVIILIRSRMLNLHTVIICILIMIFGKIAEKIGMEFLYVLGTFDYEQVGQFYRTVFGTEVTTMTMNVGSIEFVRVQSSSDAIVFSLSPLLWFLPAIKREIRGILFILTGVFSIIVFSRVYLVQFAFFAVIFIIYYADKFSRKIKFGAGAVILLSAFVWLRPVIDLFKIRFFSAFSTESDSIRMQQLEKFMERIPDHLWLGRGMGSFLPDYLRNINTPFSYELEYVSYIYQLGIIGFIFIIVGMIAVYIRHIYKYCRHNKFIIRFMTWMIIIWFLMRPLFNPSFLGKQNGFIMLGLLLINAYCYIGQKMFREC